MRYLFATNINDTGESGITDLETMKVLCLCTKDNSEALLEALNMSGVMDSAENEFIRWVLKNRMSTLIKADIPLSSKCKILNSQGYSSKILEY